MNSTDITKTLLSRGYFPAELPPTFTTNDLSDNIIDVLADWRANNVYSTRAPQKLKGGIKLHGSYIYDVPHAEAEQISKPKKGYERRNIFITHPLPQSLLCREIGENWPIIAKMLARGQYSSDEIKFSEDYPRGVKDINFDLHREKLSSIAALSDWLVRTDITRFYPSIYTHSIAWAAYGKEKVKANRPHYKGSLADRLDQLVRSTNRNQTIGIPIGPATSRILAELISSDVDLRISTHLAMDSSSGADRLQDDWHIGTNSLESAERILSCLISTYSQYGLEINGSKTNIEHIATIKQDNWLIELRGFLVHSRSRLKENKLREFLNLAMKLQFEYPTSPVTNYVISVIENASISSRDTPALESFLLKSAKISPGSMDRICRVFLTLDKIGKLSTKKIVRRLLVLLENSLKDERQYEAIWILQTLRGLKKPFLERPVNLEISKSKSSALRLIALDMKHFGILKGDLHEESWIADLDEDRILSDSNWLLAYEGIRHGWLADPRNLSGSKFFSPMLARKIAFYDPQRKILSWQDIKRTQSKAKAEQKKELLAFFGVDDHALETWLKHRFTEY